MRNTWWKSPKDKVAANVVSIVDKLLKDQESDRRLAEHLSVLTGRPYTSVIPGRARPTTYMWTDRDDRLILNAIANIYETLKARITTNRPRPKHMVKDGSWSDKMMAKRLDRFSEGLFYKQKLYELMAEAFGDGMWANIGAIHGWVEKCESDDEDDDGYHYELRGERVFPGEIVVDEQAALTSMPRSMFRVKYIPAEVLMARFPKMQAAIEKASEDTGSTRDDTAVIATSLVRTIEAWHLRSSKALKDGRHCIVIDGAVLMDDRKWCMKRFPFSFIRWSKMPIGWAGQGLVEQLRPLHEEKNKLARRIQDAMHLMATVWIECEKGTIPKGHLKNRPAIIVEREPGKQPIKITTPSSMNSEVFNHVKFLDDQEYRYSGTSQLSAAGVKPAGVEAGVAFRELQDIETGRQGTPTRAWENLALDITDMFETLAEYHYSDGDEEKGKPATDYEVRHRGARFYETIKWSEVREMRREAELTLYPTNILPSTPAGKLATVQELIAGGFIDQKTGNALLDFPDLERAQSLENAAIDLIDWAAEKMLEPGGDYIAPRGYQDLDLGIMRMGMILIRSEMEGAPQDRLQLLQRWITEASARIEKALEVAQAKAAAQQAAMAPPPGPPAGPESGPGPDMAPPTGMDGMMPTA